MKIVSNKSLVIFVSMLFICSYFVAFVGVSGDEPEWSDELNKKMDSGLEEANGFIKLRVNIYNYADLKQVTKQLEEMGADILRTNAVSIYYLVCNVDSALIYDIASIPAVEWMQQEFEPQTLMNQISSNTYMGHDTPQAGGFAGNGVLAEVQDNGCDADAVVGPGNGHPDLSNVLWTDGGVITNDHGTCVSGIMFGTGAGDPTAEGILPQGTGAFAQWNTGNYPTIQNLWNGNFNEGPSGLNGIAQTNSWWSGAVMTSQYDSYSNEIDTAAFDFPHVLNHWACGNSNFGVGPSTMSTESVSKNDISGGAIFHMDTATLSDDDWHNNGGGSTPSQGPAADGRQKPDLCGPFDWIHTTDEDPGGYVGGMYYDNFGGTSGATPNIAGSSCLVYDMYQDNYFDNNPGGNWPYSCTVKAMMIANAYQYPIGVNGIYRGVEGWGTPDLEYMYNLGPTYHVIEEYPQAMNAGDSWSRGVYSDGTNPLKITLCWIDPPAPPTTGTGRALINNLNLRVQSPSGTVYWGNNGLYNDIWSTSGTGANNWYDPGAPGPNYADNLNNVENVFLQTPASGVWTIEVTGQIGDIGSGPQDFSMVASGAQGISSAGTIALDRAIYVLEDTATVTVSDLDLNVLPGVAETVDVTVDSTTEPGGELLTLTETGPDTSTFVNSITLSATNGAGILQVSHADIVTATYNDADDGSGNPAVVTDTATIDGSPPGPPTGLTVQWIDYVPITVWQDDFEDGDVSDWTATPGTGIGGVSTDTANSGIWSMYSAEGTHTWDSPVMDLSILSSADLSVWIQQGGAFGNSENPDAGEDLQVSYLNDAASWNLLGTFAGADAAGTIYTPTFPLPADSFHSSFQVRFYQTGGSGATYDYWHWDDPIVQGLQVTVGSGPDNKLDWILSVDDGGGDNDVALYNIYRANNEFGPWDAGAYIDSVPPGTITYTDPGRGEFDGINWWYVVRAEDAMGNEEQNTVAVPEIPPGNVPPSIPTNPVPAHLATGVGLNPALSVDVADPNGDSMDVSFYDASGPTLIGTDFGVPSTGTATVNWLGLSADTTYNWYAEAYDGEFTTQSATWQFTTIDMTPPGPPTGLTVEWWGTANTILYQEDFEGDGTPTFAELGWTTGGGSNDWQIGTPAGLGGDYGNPDPVGAVSGTFSIGNDLTGLGPFPGDYEANIAVDSNWIYSPAVDCSQATSTMLYFQRHLNVEQPLYDHAYLEISTNGATWFEVWTNLVGTEDSSWSEYSYDISGWADNQATVYIRFEIGSTDVGWQYSGWNIDDLRVEGNVPGLNDDNWLNWTLSADDGGGANDVALYNIYRANNAGGPWDAGAYIDSVPAGTDTYMDFGRGQPDGINWWYVVRAEDTVGNEELNTNAVPEIPVADNPPTVTVDAPGSAPGESYLEDDTVNIDWTANDDNPWGPTPNCWVYLDDDNTGYDGDEILLTNAVDASVGTYAWDTGGYVGTWWIYIVVEDSAAQPGSDYSTFSFTVKPIFSIGSLMVGWNLISIPLIPDVTTVPNVLLDLDGDTTWTIIQYYDPLDSDPWKCYATFKPPPLNDLNDVNHTMGVWLYIPDAVALGDGFIKVTGTQPITTNINLWAGWNLVGYPSDTSLLASIALIGTGADIIAVFDPGQPYRIRDEIDLSLVTMMSGNAYWIHVPADTIWTLNW